MKNRNYKTTINTNKLKILKKISFHLLNLKENLFKITSKKKKNVFSFRPDGKIYLSIFFSFFCEFKKIFESSFFFQLPF